MTAHRPHIDGSGEEYVDDLESFIGEGWIV
jgi:hypothetical protein